jgi:ABC-type glycerol-3-phosphate transport system permease component
MKSRTVIQFLVYLCLIVFIVASVGPFFLILRTSLQKTLTLTGSRNPEYTLVNYINLLTKTKFPRWLLNSVVFAGV